MYEIEMIGGERVAGKIVRHKGTDTNRVIIKAISIEGNVYAFSVTAESKFKISDILNLEQLVYREGMISLPSIVPIFTPVRNRLTKKIGVVTYDDGKKILVNYNGSKLEKRTAASHLNLFFPKTEPSCLKCGFGLPDQCVFLDLDENLQPVCDMYTEKRMEKLENNRLRHPKESFPYCLLPEKITNPGPDSFVPS
ncbi:hypothetical protein KAR26_01370 [Candidatus Parcubacteria bacterium]|nr:hypothetical protein [Candidatus Parcubacteria bacterium]